MTLKQQVMMRIYTLYTIGKVRTFFAHGGLIIVCAAFIIFLISVPDVFANMPKKNLNGFYIFSITALKNTTLTVKILLLGMFGNAVAHAAQTIYLYTKNEAFKTHT